MGVSITGDTTIKNDFSDDISLGKIPGTTLVNIGGCNPDIDTGGEEDLWGQGGNLVYLSSPETMDIVSTSIDDDVGGTGATSLFISGILAGAVVTDTIALDGTTPVTSTQTFDRINFMFLFGAGSGQTNAGDITATASTAATVQCRMLAGLGITQHGFYSVPAGKTIVIKQIELNATKTGGGASPIINFRVYARFSPASPWIVITERRLDVNVQDSLVLPFPASGLLSPGADIRFSAVTDQNNTEALCRLTGIQYDV